MVATQSRALELLAVGLVVSQFSVTESRGLLRLLTAEFAVNLATILSSGVARLLLHSPKLVLGSAMIAVPYSMEVVW